MFNSPILLALAGSGFRTGSRNMEAYEIHFAPPFRNSGMIPWDIPTNNGFPCSSTLPRATQNMLFLEIKGNKTKHHPSMSFLPLFEKHPNHPAQVLIETTARAVSSSGHLLRGEHPLQALRAAGWPVGASMDCFRFSRAVAPEAVVLAGNHHFWRGGNVMLTPNMSVGQK